MTQPTGCGRPVSALGLGRNGVPFQACLSHMGTSAVLLLTSFPELKGVVGAWRWGKGGGILNFPCFPGTQGSGEIKHCQCDQNKQAVPLLWNIRKKALEGQSCWQKCFRNIFAPLPITEPAANSSNRTADHLRKQKFFYRGGGCCGGTGRTGLRSFCPLSPGTDMFDLGVTDSGERSWLIGWLSRGAIC